MTKKLAAIVILGVGLTLVGSLLLVAIIRNRAVNIVSTPAAPAISQTAQSDVATAAVTPTPEGAISGMPNRIIIPSINVDLPVIPGYYDAATGEWTLTKNNVQFATPTVQPNNQAGNTFIYGHALSNLFGSLPKLQAGAVAIVKTGNGHIFYYTLSSTRVVSPSDSGVVLGYTGKPILTLQTCVGLLYQNRELLTFDFQRVA